MTDETAKKPLLTLLMSFIIVATIFLLLPFAIYMGNAAEFSVPFIEIISWNIVPAFGLLLLLMLPSLFMSAKYHRVYTYGLAVFGLLLWVHGSLIVWDYGPLDGRVIDWDADSWKGWVDVSIWVIAILVAIVVYRRLGTFILRFAALFFLVQLLVISVQTIQNLDHLNKDTRHADRNTLDQLAGFSSKGNVLHILLDGFESDVFEELVLNDKDIFDYKDKFKGFTYFKEALSVFPYTRFAVPAFLSGEVYHNNIPKNEFISSVLGKKSLLNNAFDNGYEVDIASMEYWAPLYGSAKHTNSYIIPFDTYASSRELKVYAATRLLDMSLFRVVPHWLKKHVYNDQKWFVNKLFVNSELLQQLYFSHTRFLNYIAENMNVSRDAPVYKYFHVMNTHNPMVVNEQCGYAGGVLPTNRYTLTVQSKCTLDTVVRLFDKMRELGVYDDTLIVIHGDHGGWVPVKGFHPPNTPDNRAVPAWVVSLGSPLLAIKLPGDHATVRESHELASLIDIPNTVSHIMGWKADFPGEALFSTKPDAQRERSYYVYSWQKDAWDTDYTGPIQEFRITGSHYTSAWRAGRVFNPPQ